MQGRSYLRIIGAERGQPRAQVVLRGAPGLREQPGGIQISRQPLSDPGTQGWLLSDLPQPIALQEGLHKLAEPIEPPPEDVIGAPGALEEPTKVVQCIPRYFVREPTATKTLLGITWTHPNGFNDVFLTQARHHFDGKQLHVKLPEALVGHPDRIVGRQMGGQDLYLGLLEQLEYAVKLRCPGPPDPGCECAQ